MMLVSGDTTIQLGSLSAAAQQQITQAVAIATASAAAAAASAEAASAAPSGIADAPLTSLSYVRNNGGWVPKDKIVLNWLWAAYDGMMESGIPAIFIKMGDSHTVGQGTGDTGPALLGNARPYSSTQQMVDYLIAAGLRVTSDSFFGDQNIFVTSGSAGVMAYDTRLTIPSGWTAAQPANSLGGSFWTTSGEVTDPFEFQPENPWDQCDIFYITVPGGATEVDVYQGATKIGQYSCATSAVGIQKSTFTGTLQSGVPVKIVDSAGGSGGAFLTGIVTRNTASPSLEVYQCGWGGAVIANLADTSTAYTPLAFVSLIKPNALVIEATVNDTTAGTDPAAYEADMATIQGVATTYGDFGMVVGFPGNVPGTTGAPPGASPFAPILDAYKRAMENRARLGLGFVTDLREIFGNSWAIASTKGLVFDNYHGNRAGAAIVGKRYGAITISARS